MLIICSEEFYFRTVLLGTANVLASVFLPASTVFATIGGDSLLVYLDWGKFQHPRRQQELLGGEVKTEGQRDGTKNLQDCPRQ